MKKEIRLALSFLLALVLLYVGINFLKGKNLFSSHATYYVTYSDVSGLSTSSPIYTHGVRIGSVDAIVFNWQEPYDIVVRIRVKKDLALPAGTTAVLNTELLGSVTMNLLLPAGETTQTLAPGDTLRGYLDRGMMATIGELMPEAQTLLANIGSCVQSLQTLAADSTLAPTLHALPATLHRVNELMGDLSATLDVYHGVGQHLDTLGTTLNRMAGDVPVATLVARADSTLTALNALAAQLQDGNGTLSQLLADPSLYQQLDSLTNEARSLVTDVKEHPDRYLNLSTLFGRNKH